MEPGTVIQPGQDDQKNKEDTSSMDEPTNTNDMGAATDSGMSQDTPAEPTTPPVSDSPMGGDAPADMPKTDMPSGDGMPTPTPTDDNPIGGDMDKPVEMPGGDSPPPAAGDSGDTPSTETPAEMSGSSNSSPEFSWEASEYIQHQHSVAWYLGLSLVTIALVAISLLVIKEWLSAVVVIVMMSALVVYAHKTPRVLRYQLDEAGLKIDGKDYLYSAFRAFAIINNRGLLTIELEPLKRFMPRLAIFLDKDDVSRVSAILERHLPREDRQADLIDRLSHALKF